MPTPAAPHLPSPSHTTSGAEPVTALLRLSTDLSQPARWRQLRQLVQVIEATTLAEVKSSLKQLEEGCAAGLHAAGFISYEAAPALNPALVVNAATDPENDFPLLWFGLFREEQEVTLPAAPAFTAPLNWQPATTRPEYDQAIADIRAHIEAGETYQTNYTLRLRAPLSSDFDSLSYFAALATAQPTPYAAYLNTGRWQVLSASPELFFRVRQRTITTKPMKGTTGRGRVEAEDAAQAAWLASSEKNRAENVMIVDLLRNDLGQVAQFGSVKVSELCAVERYPSLYTMTSTITAQLRPHTSLTNILTALFPCGSVTGAPKISTMRFIAQLERQPRRVYCGAVGYIAPGGDCVFNVPIRTVLLDRLKNVAEYGVGGGITWDSDAAGEYAELLTKAKVLDAAIPSFDLLETLRLQDGKLVNAPQHLARLTASARYFGRPCEPGVLATTLARARQHAPTGTYRLRLLLHPDGSVDFQAFPLEVTPTVNIQLAKTPVQSGNVFLFHKTTHRAVYQQAAKEVKSGCEALLLNERGELTEFVTGNLVLELRGKRYTPPVSCGLLPGIARALALQNGEIEERALTVSDLQQATAIWHINSLRGWRRAEWIE